MRTAISYTRFSDVKQAGGDSIARQEREFIAFCERHGLAPAAEHFADHGRSGYKGMHRAKGALGRFEALVKDGTVPRGTVLVIEAIDRLSREHPVKAMNLLSSILTAGVDIGVTRFGFILTEADLDSHNFIMLAAFVQLAHQESKQKSERVAASWKTRRRLARAEKRPISGRVPAWVEVRAGKFRSIPDRVAVVRKIFDLASSGYGLARIVRTLTAENVLAFGSKRGRWNKSYVAIILRDRRAVGEYQPTTASGEPDGAPIFDYYPVAVTEAQFALAQTGVTTRGKSTTRQRKYVNIFQGLLRDAEDRGTFHITSRGSASNPNLRLVNAAGLEGKGPRKVIPYYILEAAFLTKLREVDASEILPPADGGRGPSRLDALKAQASLIASEIEKLKGELRKRFTSAVADVLHEQEGVAAKLKEEIVVEAAKEATPPAKDWNEFRNLATILAESDDPDDARIRLQAVMKRRFSEIWVRVCPARGAARLLFIQAWFADPPTKHRDFLLYYRWGGGKGARWDVRSWPEEASLDLRNPSESEIVAKTIEGMLLAGSGAEEFFSGVDAAGAAVAKEILDELGGIEKLKELIDLLDAENPRGAARPGADGGPRPAS